MFTFDMNKLSGITEVTTREGHLTFAIVPGVWKVPTTWRLSVIRIAIATLGGTGLIAMLCGISGAYTSRYSCALAASVNFIATYHYYAIYKLRARELERGCNYPEDDNDADLIRHTDWCLTLPLMVIDLYRLSDAVTGSSESWMNDNVAALLAFLMIVLGVIYRFSDILYLEVPSFVFSCIIFGFVVHAITAPVFGESCDKRELDSDNCKGDRYAVLVFTYVWIGYPIAALLSSSRIWSNAERLSFSKDVAYAFLDIVSKAGLAFYIGYRTTLT
tara:strand:- start:1695 stop:2516 length:822 start_codon:yes stop_codon:yes gene_type:complete